MEGDPRIDKLMLPVAKAIKDSLNGKWSSGIYNRAYEAVLQLMGENDELKSRAEAAEAKVKDLSVLLENPQSPDAFSAILLYIHRHFSTETQEQLVRHFVGDKYLEAEAKVRELEAAQRWFPVTERLPEEGQEVIVRDRNGFVSSWRHSDQLARMFTRHWAYWMPIPPLLKPEGV